MCCSTSSLQSNFSVPFHRFSKSLNSVGGINSILDDGGEWCRFTLTLLLMKLPCLQPLERMWCHGFDVETSAFRSRLAWLYFVLCNKIHLHFRLPRVALVITNLQPWVSIWVNCHILAFAISVTCFSQFLTWRAFCGQLLFRITTAHGHQYCCQDYSIYSDLNLNILCSIRIISCIWPYICVGQFYL